MGLGLWCFWNFWVEVTCPLCILLFMLQSIDLDDLDVGQEITPRE